MKKIREVVYTDYRRPNSQRIWVARIYQYNNHHSLNGKYFIQIENDETGWCDNPLKIRGNIYYDFPERIPKYAKDLVCKAYKYAESMGLMRKNGYD